MTVERGLRLVAGSFIMASAALAYFHNPAWLLFTGFVGLNLFQSAFTNWCPMVWLLEKAGLPRCDGGGASAGAEPGHRKPGCCG